jgi:hypothetical protein
MRVGILVFAAAAPFIGATQITFDTLPQTLENGTFNGFVGGTINGLRFDDLICDDFLPTTYVPSGPWEYDLSFLTGPDPLEFARFGSGVPAKTKYEQAALLLIGDGTQNLPGLLNVHSSYDITSYQYVLWRLFTPDSAMSGHVAVINPGDSDLLLNKVRAENLFSPGFLGTYARLRIYTPGAPAASNQEFLQAAHVPEPATWATGAGGTLLLVFFAVRHRVAPVRRQLDRATFRSPVT